MAPPTGNAAAVIHLADGGAIDPATIGREVDVPVRPPGVRVLRLAAGSETGVLQPNVDLALQVTACPAGSFDGKVLDQSGRPRVALCQWGG
ncbi:MULTISPECIES: hypothetical protein [Micromonospora]|uniref:hypothetical protein n=1 Tax=Micromonospora TaxID=1873 RepID=UPI0021C6863C|nr:hypothetical protein [Micromonospora sp. Mcm103]